MMKNRVLFSAKTTNNESGFAIPIALGLGFITLLLATTAMVRSQNGHVAAINAKDTARSQIAAETGIAKFLEFINQYRSIASYPACSGTWNNDGTCPDTGTTASWAVPANLPTNINAVCTTPANLSDAQTIVRNRANNNWTNIDASDTATTDPKAHKGQYRLVSYRNDILTVEGRVNGGTSNEAIARIQVQVPFFDTATEQTAGLWVRESVSDNPQINADVMGSCTATLNATFPTGSQYRILRTRLTMPAAAPAAPASGQYYTLTNISSISTTAGNLRELPRTIAKGATTDDQPDTDGLYKYIVTSLDESFKVPLGKRVRIWITGNIDLSNKVIVNECGTDSNCDPFDVRIYGTSTSGSLTLNPYTRICDVFLGMPNHDVTFSTATTGTASTQNCGSMAIKNTGVYWVKSWTGAGSGTVLDSPRAKWGQSWGTIVPPPRIGATGSWTPLQVE